MENDVLLRDGYYKAPGVIWKLTTLNGL